MPDAQAARSFLKDYASLQENVRKEPARADDESLTGYMRRVGALEDTSPRSAAQTATRPATLPARGQAAQASPADAREERERARVEAKWRRIAARKQAQEAQDAADAAAAEEEERRANRSRWVGRGLGLLGVPPDAAADTAERWRARIASLPTPGGNAAMVALLLGFIAFIVPVNEAGYTRAQLAWLTLLGRTSLDSSGAPDSEPVTHPGPPAEPVTHTEPVTHVSPQSLPFTLPLPGTGNGPALPLS